jgi:hypothetical protein
MKLIIFIIGILIGMLVSNYTGEGHGCPMPSVEYVQATINEHKPDWDTPLVVDGVAGPKTVKDWMFYSTGWQANNERNVK